MFFLGIISWWKGVSYFNGERVVFQMGGTSFLSGGGGCPMGGHQSFFFGGGGVRKKFLIRGRAPPPPPPPPHPPPPPPPPHTPLPLLWETLIHPHTKTFPFWKAEETQDHSFETVGGYRSSCANIEKIISNFFGNGISHYSKYFYHISI